VEGSFNAVKWLYEVEPAAHLAALLQGDVQNAGAQLLWLQWYSFAVMTAVWPAARCDVSATQLRLLKEDLH
jgi:hypothetical protein